MAMSFPAYPCQLLFPITPELAQVILKDPRRGKSIHIPGIPSHNSTTRPGDTGSAPATAKDTTAEDIMNLERRTDA